MRLYFKMRDIENVDDEGQKEFIRKYIEDYCHFGRCGVEIDSFIDHRVSEPGLKGKHFVVGSYQVRKDADFDRIQLKIKLFDVHRYFVIFAIL